MVPAPDLGVVGELLGARSLHGGAEEGVILHQPDVAEGPSTTYASYYSHPSTIHEVHIKWLPLLEDFERCHSLSWGSAVLVWTYHFLCSVAHRFTNDVAEYTPLLIFSVVSTQEIDFNIFAVREFDDEQWAPEDPVNVDWFLTTTGQGEDVWCSGLIDGSLVLRKATKSLFSHLLTTNRPGSSMLTASDIYSAKTCLMIPCFLLSRMTCSLPPFSLGTCLTFEGGGV
ncbi:hypothetical protein Ahy_B01g054476 [Arachis hypogaea]|uniref:Aminotransferase-like plant mobile domain-containing protein n=1 Tax=Arachis hypogaea TaxID=3818 RepID=A0A445ATX7_ARAHY|nr:hypothetical protein Ahy_B01g054476 [Arachis hypogaea]